MDDQAREEYCLFLLKQAMGYIDSAQENYEQKIKTKLSKKEIDIFNHAFISGSVSVGIFLTDEKRS